jgi:hypothetical protein
MSFAEQNPYRAPLSSVASHVAALAAETERATFIRRTYTHLTAAILGFVGIEFVIFSTVPAELLENLVFRMFGPWTWLAFLGAFMVVSWVARSWAESSVSKQTQYLGLGLYVVAEALLFVPLLYVAQFYSADPNLIPAAGIITMVMFGGLTFAVFLTKADFSYLRMYLMWGGILAIALVVCGALFAGFSLGIWFSVLMVALASGYILYDTSNVLHHYRTDQYVAASLALFASVALLFWYVIRILMYLTGRD